MTPDEAQRLCIAGIRHPEAAHKITAAIGALVLLHSKAVSQPRTVEAWEDGPHGIGMSDKAASTHERAMAAMQECSTRYRRALSALAKSEREDREQGRVRIVETAAGPMLDDGTHGPLREVPEAEAVRGITHGPGSPVAALCGKPINPELDGDGA